MGIINSITNKFMFGMSVLESYIRLSNKMNMYDVNVVSENFFCNLLNILYDYKLINKNREERNAAGFDLISRRDKVIIQVTRTCTSTKINETIDVIQNNIEKINSLECRISELKENSGTQENLLDLARCESELKRMDDIRDYRLKFLFLVNDSHNMRKNANHIESPVKFNPDYDIIDFSSLCTDVHYCISFSEKERLLLQFMDENKDLFEPKIFDKIHKKDRVNEIISDYARNFESRLFLHRYEEQSIVTLKNMYISPPFVDFDSPTVERRDIITLLCDFLWKRDEDETNDNERILFIEGDAAIGKTSFVSWLCYNYQQISSAFDDNDTNRGDVGRAIFLNRKMVCVRLRELDLSESKYSPEKMILEYLGINNRDEFSQEYKDAIFILDGADELAMVSGSSGKSIESFILGLRQAFHSHKFIITSRPKFLKMQMFEKKLFAFRRIILTHYNAIIREEWVDNYKKCNEIIPEETEQYIKELSDKNAEGVADTPLALYLLVRCEMKKEMQGNNWALFNQIFSSAIVDGEYNDSLGGEYTDFSLRKSRVNYLIVEHVAFKMFQNSSEERYFIRGAELEEVIKCVDLEQLSPEVVKQTCVLCAYWKNTDDLGALEFYHNNIRDFFLCEYIYDCLMKSFSSKSLNLEESLLPTFCELFQWGSISGTTWEQTFAFLYLRLRYEKQYAKGKDNLYSLLKEKLDATQLIQALISSKLIWAYDYIDNTYVSVKKVITNTMLLIRLLQDFVSDQDILCLWKTEEQKKNWQYVNLYSDWQELLKNTVEIDGAETIGVASKTKFEHCSFERFDLCSTQFNECLFENVSFSRADLSKANFAGAFISNVDFSDSNLIGADFSGAEIINVTFNGASLEGAKFDKTIIRGCTWENCIWGRNTFVKAEVENLCIVYKTSKKVEGLDFTGAILNKCVFRNIKFNDVILFNTKVKESEFKKCEFCGNLLNSEFTSVKFHQMLFSDLEYVQDCLFSECVFDDSNFIGMNLTNVLFKDSDLRRASFDNSTLNECIFEGQKTLVKETRFYRTTNNGSTFIGVNIHEANLRGAKGFKIVQK